MQVRERPAHRDPEQEIGGPAGDETRVRREASRRFAAAGRSAIERALSSDSKTFLRQGRQASGE